jgi:hypothetical protein
MYFDHDLSLRAMYFRIVALAFISTEQIPFLFFPMLVFMADNASTQSTGTTYHDPVAIITHSFAYISIPFLRLHLRCAIPLSFLCQGIDLLLNIGEGGSDFKL